MLSKSQCCSVIFVLFSIVVSAFFIPNPACADPIYWEGNGHHYEVFTFDSPLEWEMAYLEAREREYNGEKGYLATITSAEENEFIGSTFSNLKNYALGGYQSTGSLEPAGGWRWITGELFIYQNWVSGEPNNMGGEDYMAIGYTNNREWNDVLWTYGGIVEYGDPGTTPTPPGGTPEPATAMLIASATGVLAFIRRKRRKAEAAAAL